MMRTMVFVLASGVLAACGSTQVVAPTVNVSVGQQLIDLKTTKDSGSPSQADRESQRTNLIRSVE